MFCVSHMTMDLYGRKGEQKKEELAHALHDADKKKRNTRMHKSIL